ncbi:Negative elongation factor A [Schistosoma japonicum]|uniref:Negative elongation factor A n=1 Tax=Schistosoma japonicum TaxID=6182 RepID=A0A4Z2DXT0_SCHJA|nr:Negative elongation factor A [Schistosoma japonicum]
MSDLMKFVRQQFFDNNWTKSVDPDSLSEEKLDCIDTSFSHMDVKSKLCLLLAFSNMKQSSVQQINKHIENIFLQALDEENNLVKAVATILHSKQTLNYLNFDISPTNEAFGKNIDKLLKTANNWNAVDTPLLAEYLGRNVLDKFNVKESDKPSTDVSKYGFHRRGKLESEYLKESYLEKLKDECQRRRVHVPIPGRSFTRQDEAEDPATNDVVNNPKNPVTSQPDSATSSRRKGTFPRFSGQNSDDFHSKRSLMWTHPNINKSGNSENKPISANDRLSNRNPAMSGTRKHSGIKLLEFDELPAFGPKAKQLRKEKERETKLKLKQEREERAREIKAAREASKLTRQSERQALIEARKQNISIPRLWPDSHQEFSENNKTGIQGIPVNRTSEFLGYDPAAFEIKPSFTVLPKNFSQDLLRKTDSSNQRQFPVHFINSTSNVQSRFITPNMDVDIKPVIHHPLLSASVPVGPDNNAIYAEDDDDDDDDDDDILQNGESGVYFHGFAKNLSFNVPFSANLTSMQSTVNTSGPMTSFAELHSLSSQSQSIGNISVSSLGRAHLLQCLPSNNSASFSSPVSQTLSTPVNHIKLIRPSIPQSNTGGIVKVLNTLSNSPVRIICVMDQNSSKTPSDTLMQSGKPLNIDITQSKTTLNENINHELHNNSSQSSESMYPTSTSGTAQVLSQRVVSNPSESVPSKFTTSCLPAIRPKPTNSSNTLVCIAPRPNRLIPMNSVNNNNGIYENTATSQPIINTSGGGNPIYLSPSYPIQQQAPIGVIRSSNSTVVIDNRPVVLATTPTLLTSPQIQSQQPQLVQRFSVIAPKQPSLNQTYIQILPRPTATTIQTRPSSLPIVRPLSQSKVHVNSPDPSLQTNNHQVVVSSAFGNNNTSNYNINISNLCDIPSVSITTSLPNYNLLKTTSNSATSIVPDEINVIRSSQSSLTSVSGNNIVSSSANLSSVKIQDDLCLTESQLSVVQNLFQDANRVTRPEKAMIISFIAGSRDNPRPETGQITRIRLSEHRERVINQNTGQLVDLAVDTFLTMDYSTGKYEKVKCYRSDTPENLAGNKPNSGFIGPLTQAEYEQLYPRNDKPDLLAEVAAEENEWVEFERLDEKEAVQAGTAAWAPLKPPFIDSHFSIWSLSESVSSSQLYLGGKLPPPPTASWAKVLRRDYTADDYEEEMDYMRARAENEIKYEVGELAPVRYAIHVQVASTYSESLMISSLAEDYYCIAGYVGWCDLSDPSLSNHIQQMCHDPLLVGLRYDVSEMDGDYLLDSLIDSNFSAIEHQQLVFDLAIGPHQLRHACHLAYRHPKLKLVLNHCGLPVEFTASRSENLAWKNWRADLELLSRYPNVYCKVTGATGCIQKSSESSNGEFNAYDIDYWCASSALTHAVSCFGPDRCLFGSGWPICRLFQPNQTGWPEQASTSDLQTFDIPGEIAAKRARRSVPLKVLNLWETARLVEHSMGDAGYGSTEDKEKIFSTNAQHVYSLSIRPYGSCPQLKHSE